jgi:hypothetical protein
VAQAARGVDSGSRFVIEWRAMGRFYFFAFFYFPCLLAEGTG